MYKYLSILSMQICLLFSAGLLPSSVHAEPYLGEVRWFAGNFAPRGWAFCDGQYLSIASNSALFSLLGTYYGGDGRTNFRLPDMRGRAMMHAGNGPGLTPRPQGQVSGQENVALTTAQLPSHSHTLKASDAGGDSVLPVDRVLSQVGRLRVYAPGDNTDMGATAITSSGSGQPHNNMQPFVTMSCIIAITGVYPSRS